MFKCISPGAVGIKLDWEKCLPLAKSAGFEGIDVEVDPAKSASWHTDRLAAAGLRPGAMVLPVDFLAEPAKYRSSLAVAPKVLARAREVGVTRFFMWIFPFHDTLTLKENFRLHVERLKPAAALIADAGGSLALEFVGPKTMRVGRRFPFLRTMEQMLDLAEAVGPNAGLLLDSFHWYTSLGTVEDILALDKRQVIYVHLNDAAAGVAVDKQVDNVRALPGATGVIDLAGFLGALKKIGYSGPVVPEPFDASLAKLPPEEAAKRVGAAMAKVWL